MNGLDPAKRRIADRSLESVAVAGKGGGAVLVRPEGDLVESALGLAGHAGGLLGRHPAVGEGLPFVEERGVDRANERPQPLRDLVDLVRAGLERHGLPQGLVDVREVAQKHALAARQVVARDELGKRLGVLHHFPHDRFRGEVVAVHPRIRLTVDGQGPLQKLREGPRPRDGVRLGHPLLVAHSGGLHPSDRLAARRALLRVEHLHRIFLDGLYHRDDVERIVGGLAFEQVEGREREGGQRRVEGEVARNLAREIYRGFAGVGSLPLDVVVDEDPRRTERFVDFDRPSDQGVRLGFGLVVVRQQTDGGGHRIPGALQKVEDHGVVDAHLRGQLFRRRVLKVRERLLSPQHHAFGGFLSNEFLEFLGVPGGFFQGFRVLYLVLGGLDDDVARRVEPGPARPAGDLVEFAGRKVA